MLQKQIKHGAHYHVSMGPTKTETLGAVRRDNFTVVNYPFTKGNCVNLDSPEVNVPWRLFMDTQKRTEKVPMTFDMVKRKGLSIPKVRKPITLLHLINTK